jgi:tRNA dimethylallyltransferase
MIVGGTSFYLKTLLYGLSPMPKISEETYKKTVEYLCDIEEAHHMLLKLDEDYMSRIKSMDSYRIEKMLNLFFETGLTPTEYFRANPPEPTITTPLPIYEISVDREILRDRIRRRTEKMWDMGLIDEVSYLENKYGRTPNCMKSIGVREVLDLFDGVYTEEEAKEKMVINTARLAKRQRTFNRSQFKDRVSLPLDELRGLLL